MPKLGTNHQPNPLKDLLDFRQKTANRIVAKEDLQPAKKASKKPAPKFSKPRQPTESQMRASLLFVARNHPLMAWFERFNTGALKNDKKRPVFFGIPGFPDFIGQTKFGGVLVAIECKRESKRHYMPRNPNCEEAIRLQRQADWQARIRLAGGISEVVCSPEELRELLDRELSEVRSKQALEKQKLSVDNACPKCKGKGFLLK